MEDINGQNSAQTRAETEDHSNKSAEKREEVKNDQTKPPGKQPDLPPMSVAEVEANIIKQNLELKNKYIQ